MSGSDELVPESRGRGRPKGSKDSRPRIKRSDVLQANREQWAKWSQSDGLLKAARKRLLEIINSPDASDKDAIAAIKLGLEYDVGRPTEAKEQPVPQPLMIMLAQPDGTYQKLPEVRTVELEVIDAGDGTPSDATPD